MPCIFLLFAGDDFYEKTGSNTVEVCISKSLCERSAKLCSDSVCMYLQCPPKVWKHPRQSGILDNISINLYNF